jgi:hypothetical protein
MAVLRFCRDKRGYEHFYLIEPAGRTNTAARMLYWFRTPPGVTVGRDPFSEAIRGELEQAHPDVAFDWRRIVATPIPSADAERWRERRRAERALRQARRAEAAQPEPGSDDDSADEAPDNSDDDAAQAPIHVMEAAVEKHALDVAAAVSVDAPRPGPAVGVLSADGRRRRRRRRGRGGGGSATTPGRPSGSDV